MTFIPSKTHVAVLKGGWSPEREVSLVSGAAVAAALRKAGYAKVTEIDAGADLGEALAKVKPDVVFNALHGVGGEDGCVQGLLEVMKLPYTHSGVLSSALAMDKDKAKSVFRAAKLPVAEDRVVDRREAGKGHVLTPPYVIKPVAQGSSVGVFLVREGDNRPPSELLGDDWAFGDRVMVEAYVPGRELTVAVMGTRPLGVTEILTAGWYDYTAKYAAGGSRHEVPAKVPAEVAAEACRVAVAAHEALGCRGVSRSDFRYDDTRERIGRLVILEVNTQPGMTPTSLVPELAQHIGMDFPALVKWMVDDASCGR